MVAEGEGEVAKGAGLGAKMLLNLVSTWLDMASISLAAFGEVTDCTRRGELTSGVEWERGGRGQTAGVAIQ